MQHPQAGGQINSGGGKGGQMAQMGMQMIPMMVMAANG